MYYRWIRPKKTHEAALQEDGSCCSWVFWEEKRGKKREELVRHKLDKRHDIGEWHWQNNYKKNDVKENDGNGRATWKLEQQKCLETTSIGEEHEIRKGRSRERKMKQFANDMIKNIVNRKKKRHVLKRQWLANDMKSEKQGVGKRRWSKRAKNTTGKATTTIINAVKLEHDKTV